MAWTLPLHEPTLLETDATDVSPCPSFTSHNSAATVYHRAVSSIDAYDSPSLFDQHFYPFHQDYRETDAASTTHRSDDRSSAVEVVERCDTKLDDNSYAVEENAYHDVRFPESTTRRLDHSTTDALVLTNQGIPPVADDLSDFEMATTSEPTAFKRWVSTLRRKKQPMVTPVTPRERRWTLDDFDQKAASPEAHSNHRHRKSCSNASSAGFVTAVKSATVTIASASIGTMSGRHPRLRRTQQSSLLSGPEARPSVDTQRSIIDEAARQRSRKRREKLEELVRTEEGFVADLKALANAASTLLGLQMTSSTAAQHHSTDLAQYAVSDLVHLHEDILSHLHRVVPFAEYDQSVTKSPRVERAHHHRWHSVDVVPSLSPVRARLATIRQRRRSLNISRSSDETGHAVNGSPLLVSAVAGVFLDRMDAIRNAYSDFGCSYEQLQRDFEEVQSSSTAWEQYDRAIETLSATINPTKTKEINRRRAMTVKDLLIKPIQRLPRYELLFRDLCTLTPVCDDPSAHGAVAGLLVQINEACQHFNQAKDEPDRCRKLKTSRLIGDRLVFSRQVPKAVYLQLLGPVVLCGCLHIAYRSKERVKGCYVVCILFETTLLLAAVDEDERKYKTLAGIALANATIDESDNGKWLQCHTAPHSWKVIFEHSTQIFEVILTACSAAEATVWRQQLTHQIDKQAAAVTEGARNTFELQSPMMADMRAISKAFGKPGTFARRVSVHRTATVGPTSYLNQVVIKNTQAVKEALDSSSTSSLPRSQSVATPSHVQTLAPRRIDRIRLETLLGDVWSKDLLPYPGMVVRRSGPLRAGANHVIRKFSMASIASGFPSSKRNASFGSMAQSLRKEDVVPGTRLVKGGGLGGGGGQQQRSKRPTRPALIDFHSTPEAFLPADFELEDPNTKRKRSALRTFTLTMERPFTPLLGGEGRGSAGLRRAQSVRDVAGDVGKGEGSSKEPELRPVYTTPKPGSRGPEVVGSGQQKVNKSPQKMKSMSKLLRMFG